MLGVAPGALQRYGAVSEVVARQMAEGALRGAGVEAALAVTGIAGPGGGLAEKPVGTVWFAWALRDQETGTDCMQFRGDREAVRRQAVLHALQGLLQRLG
jgi:nicotinamide-nucleotide amidase